MARYDAIMVLGSSTESKRFRQRVRTAVKFHKQGEAPVLIFSGGYWGGLAKAPRKREADVMAEYAMKLGVPKAKIYRERYSKNTTGNFYFTRKLLLGRLQVQSLLILVDRANLAKAGLMARVVLGRKYFYDFLADGPNRRLTGHWTMKQVSGLFKGIRPGDMAAVKKIMRASPYYKNYRKLL